MELHLKPIIMNPLKLGWVGIGNMRTPMVLNLLKAEYEVSVLAFDWNGWFIRN
jgi:6-phosphogluconate dehydrogenase (decarboxylating)